MSLPGKASINILRLLNTEDERNGVLAYRLLNSQQAAGDFLLSLCGYFMTAKGEQRLVLRNCLRSLLLVAIREKKCPAPQADQLMWMLNYEPGQRNARPEQFLLILEEALGLDVLALARYLFSREGQCTQLLLQRGHTEDKMAVLRARTYHGEYGQTLDLSQLGLAHLPEEARYFKELEGLDLSRNHLSCSDVFFLQGFQQLRFLDLTYNRLHKVPDGLPLLPQLQEADLRGNRIKLSLFEYLRHPWKRILKTELEQEPGFTLDQFNGQDVACLLKNWIYEAGRTQVLSLRQQGIRFVPAAIRQFPRLEVADLRKNPISSLPSWFLKIKNIRKVYCDGGVEYNPALAHEGLSVLKGSDERLPAPEKKAPPWLAKLPASHACLPIIIPLEDLPGK